MWKVEVVGRLRLKSNSWIAAWLAVVAATGGLNMLAGVCPALAIVALRRMALTLLCKGLWA